MKTIIGGIAFKVRQTGNQYFYWGRKPSGKGRRWYRIAKARVIFPVILANITESMLIAACKNNCVNSALFDLQKVAGIDSGDVAACFFSGMDIDAEWPPMAEVDRMAVLRKYIAFEEIYARDEDEYDDESDDEGDDE